MGTDSKIEWTDHTLNWWIGCSKVSAGCTNCYAEVQTFPRVQRAKGIELWGPKGERHITADAIHKAPLKWDRDAAAAGVRARVFAQSLSDTFEDRRDLDGPRAELFAMIERTPHLDYQLLTKRPENMVRLAPASWAKGWPRNVWAGCTVEDQQRADERIPHLFSAPAAVRFLSVEPQLGPIDLSRYSRAICAAVVESGPGDKFKIRPDGRALHWVIVGGESGPGARPFDLAWGRSIVEQCKAAGVPVFVKQLGAHVVCGVCGDTGLGDGDEECTACEGFERMAKGGRIVLADRKGGDIEEWPADLRIRQFPVLP